MYILKVVEEVSDDICAHERETVIGEEKGIGNRDNIPVRTSVRKREYFESVSFTKSDMTSFKVIADDSFTNEFISAFTQQINNASRVMTKVSDLENKIHNQTRCIANAAKREVDLLNSLRKTKADLAKKLSAKDMVEELRNQGYEVKCGMKL